MYLRKLLTGANNQRRLNIPKQVVEELGWGDTSWLVLGVREDGSLIIRKFLDDEGIKGPISERRTQLD